MENILDSVIPSISGVGVTALCLYLLACHIDTKKKLEGMMTEKHTRELISNKLEIIHQKLDAFHDDLDRLESILDNIDTCVLKKPTPRKK